MTALLMQWRSNGGDIMQTVITFIIRMFEAAFYSLIFISALAVAAAIITITEKEGEEHDD